MTVAVSTAHPARATATDPMTVPAPGGRNAGSTAAIGGMVEYESASQFSQNHRWAFGTSPGRARATVEPAVR